MHQCVGEERRDAVARSAAEHFDLVLMDLNMPDMDGFSATRLIRQREGKGVRTAIVALTAHDAVAYRDKCLRADMDDILTKPYTLEDCARLLREVDSLASRTLLRKSSNLPVSGGKHDLASVDAAAVASLRKLRGGTNTDLYTKLVELFRIGSADSLAQLNAAMTSNDLVAAAGSVTNLHRVRRMWARWPTARSYAAWNNFASRASTLRRRS